MTRSNPQPTPQNDRFLVNQDDVIVTEVWTEEEMEEFCRKLDEAAKKAQQPAK
jgi:hypothetical protein